MFVVRSLILLVLLLAAACASLSSTEQQPLGQLPPEFTDARGFVRSPSDSNEYRSLKLDNGLEVLLIQSDSPRAGVALDLRVGSADNPLEYPGLAHFLEHMLFLGTQKYPQPDSYQAFIRVNGGSYNATTGLDHTNYFFSIDADKLPEAMDRLAQFFLAPLFTRTYVDRELEIIEAEYRRSLDNESRALYFAATRLYNQQHPASRFSSGNRETLLAQGRAALYMALKDFYQRYYRTGRMRLVVVGKQPLEQLQRFTIDTFGKIASQPLLPLPPRPHLYNRDALPVMVEIKSKSERYSLDYSFPLPDQSGNIYSKPTAYVAYLLGHESPGTLLSWLRQRNWAKSLAAGASSIGDSYAMHVRIGLTREGNRHINAIHSALFAYINLIRDQALAQSWRYAEMAQIGETGFTWSESSRPLALARSLARMMHYVPTEQVFRAASSLFSGFVPEQTQKILDALCPENVAVKRIAPDVATDMVEPFYGAHYRLVQLEPDFAAQASPDVAGLRLPPPNPYIPEAPGIGKVSSARPSLVAHPGIYAWHYPDASFMTPKASISISISLPEIVENPANRLLLSIYQRAIQRRFEEDFYTARLSDFAFNLYPHSRGITLRTAGYDTTIVPLFSDMLEQVVAWDLSLETFERFRTELEISINNEQTSSAVNRLYRRMAANRLAHQLVYERRKEAVSGLSYNDWMELRRKLTDNPSERTLLVHGEIDATSMRQLVERVGGMFAAPLIQVDPPRILPLAGPELLSEPVRHEQKNQVLALVYGNLAQNHRNRLLVSLAANYLGGPFFHYMRTENKLGYQASVIHYDLLDHPALLFLVESSAYQPHQIKQYFNLFFASMRQQQLDADTFAQLKQALTASLREPPLKLGDETSRVWHELFRRNYEFDTKRQLLGELEKLDIGNLRLFLKQLLDPNNEKNHLWAYSGEAL